MRNILKYLARIEKQQNKGCRIVCGYEAGCLDYSLYHQLHAHGIDCVILAPTTMITTSGKRIKTDRRDVRLISKCLAFHTYSPVYIPAEMNDATKKYIRMRDDANSALVRVKQQIIAFCIRHGKVHTVVLVENHCPVVSNPRITEWPMPEICTVLPPFRCRLAFCTI